MVQKLFRALVLLGLCAILPVFAHAQSWWPATGHSDIVTNAGVSNTLMVQIVNLTPYDIYFKEANFSTPYKHSGSTNLRDEYDATAIDPDKKKSFMFAPLGVPQYLPGAPTGAFLYQNYVNTVTRPYSFVLAWDDRNGNVNENWATWTLKNVYCTDPVHCSSPLQDVDVGLFITRTAPESAELDSGFYWDLAKSILKEALSIVAVIVEPENPMAWAHLTLGLGEVSKEAFGAVQDTADPFETHKWYVTAYPFPALGSDCYRSTVPCYPSAEQADDAVKTEWGGQMGGWAQQNIIVAVELRRPVAPVPEYLCVDWYPGWVGKLGTVPVAVVTIMTVDEWNYATTAHAAQAIATGAPGPRGTTMPATAEVTTAAQMIRSILQENGRQGVLTLFSIIRDLNNEQRQVLRDLVASWRAGKALTPRQQTFLYILAVQLRNQVRREG